MLFKAISRSNLKCVAYNDNYYFPVSVYLANIFLEWRRFVSRLLYVNWYCAMVWGLASFDRADHASNVIRVPLHHSLRGLDVLNEMEKRLSTNRLKMKGLFFHVDSEENE